MNEYILSIPRFVFSPWTYLYRFITKFFSLIMRFICCSYRIFKSHFQLLLSAYPGSFLLILSFCSFYTDIFIFPMISFALCILTFYFLYNQVFILFIQIFIFDSHHVQNFLCSYWQYWRYSPNTQDLIILCEYQDLYFLDFSSPAQIFISLIPNYYYPQTRNLNSRILGIIFTAVSGFYSP